MAKSEKAVYAPGELDRVRNKLGVTDAVEARRMASILGGEVGVERGQESTAKPRLIKKTGAAGSSSAAGSPPADNGQAGGRPHRPRRRVEIAPDGDEAEVLQEAATRRPADPADDPLIPVKASYLERVKMDRFCALPEFKIKSGAQALVTMLSIFGEQPDLVNPAFINRKLNSYYKKTEQLVTSVRTLFPRNNLKRNEKLKRASPFSYRILDVLRYWNLEKMASDIAKVQSHPRNVAVSELSDILKAVYRPLFILERLETGEHIKAAFKMLYKILYLENPTEAKEKSQAIIRETLAAFNDVRRDLHYLLYPLLMKLLSDRFLPYETFFSLRRNRFMDFINAAETDRIDPAGMAAETGAGRSIALDDDAGEDAKEEDEKPGEEDPNDPEVIERKEKEAVKEKEHKAMLQGVASLEALFPKAGWERLSGFPDLYPYFRDMYNLKRNYELISPADPLLQAVVIMRILEDLFLGLRNIHFGTVVSGENGPVRVDEALNGILGSWQNHLALALEKEYLPRLSEYCRILEQSGGSAGSNYAKRLLCELHWIKRLFFFPYYKFDTLFPPPFQKKDVEPAYPAIRSLRRSLTLVASGIEQANRIGGADKQVPCDGVDNPWEPYNFAIPNPVSTRLDALLPPKKRNNATLIFFSLAFSTVLDHLVNDENSWAYRNQTAALFRNMDGIPQFGVDKTIDTETVFQESIREREESDPAPPAAGPAVQAPPAQPIPPPAGPAKPE
ncbi:MAG: hypothetical protein LBQ46_01880 [Treponema sp.]|jgi:hypothetical protein|nr:hypothetical protein [Treponema sp.]